jgi:hypothetical protein
MLSSYHAFEAHQDVGGVYDDGEAGASGDGVVHGSSGLEGVELKFIDLQLGCAYMYVCSKRGRTLSGRSSLKKMEDMIHE